MRGLIRTIGVVIALAIAAHPAAAHDHATGVVKERMDMMEDMAKRLKAIRERIEAKHDLAAIKADAEALAAHAPHITHLFPPGSTQKPTQARRTIWQNWPDFERLTKAYETETKKLVSASPDDVAALTAQVQAVTRACGGCHEKYRVKKK